jgi:tetratricopeptide (TPR) repeat protein
MPTVLEVLGMEAPAGLDGVSAAPQLEGREPEGETVLYAESLFPRLNFGWSGSRSVRRGPWKYIEAPVPELYDLATDPAELRNVANAHPDVVADLRAELADFLARGGELEAVALEIDPETRDRLDALGYVGGDATVPADGLWDFGARDPKETIGLYHELQRLPQVILSSPREEARAFVDSVLALDPRNVAILERVLRLQRRAEDPEAARETAERLVEVAPEHVEAWVALGDLRADAGDGAAALAAYSQAARLEPDDAVIAANRALALAATGRSPEALREFDRALGLDPELAEAATGKARTLVAAGRTEEAVRTLEAGLTAAGDQVDLLNNLAWLLANEGIDPARARELAGRARGLAPEDPAVLDTFGWAAIRAGRPEEAVEPLRLAWEATGDAEVRAHLGVALAESGRAEEGRAHVRAAVGEREALGRIPEIAKWAR